jgi:serine protease Do
MHALVIALVLVAATVVPQVRGRLGVELPSQPLSAAEAELLGVRSTAGAFIVSVEPGGPAHAAGLKAADFVTAVDGQPVSSPAEFAGAIAARTPGTTVRLAATRNGSPVTLTATVGAPGGAQPAIPAERRVAPMRAEGQPDDFGVVLSDLSASHSAAPFRGGALVVGVRASSVADRALVLEGDIIGRINGTDVLNADAARKLLDGVKRGFPVLITLVRPSAGGRERALFLLKP